MHREHQERLASRGKSTARGGPQKRQPQLGSSWRERLNGSAWGCLDFIFERERITYLVSCIDLGHHVQPDIDAEAKLGKGLVDIRSLWSACVCAWPREFGASSWGNWPECQPQNAMAMIAGLFVLPALC